MAGAGLFEPGPIGCPRESPEKIDDIDFLAWRTTGGGLAAEQWKHYVRTVMGLYIDFGRYKAPCPSGKIYLTVFSKRRKEQTEFL